MSSPDVAVEIGPGMRAYPGPYGRNQISWKRTHAQVSGGPKTRPPSDSIACWVAILTTLVGDGG